MAMPSGDSPQKADAFYHYLLSKHQTDRRPETWHVDWLRSPGCGASSLRSR